MASRPVYICDFQRTPIGRYGGALAQMRADDLAAIPVKALMARHDLDWGAVDQLVFGAANQSGEDNRNLARMVVLLAGLPETVPGLTVNRLCASGLDAVLIAAQSIQTGAADLVVAGGSESMSRAPFVMPKSTAAFARAPEMHDTTIGWRFVNKVIAERFGIDSMPETAENVAADWNVSREDQDRFALSSQERAAQAIAVCRELELDPFASHINPRGGAIALGHPLGMSGARIAGTAALALSRGEASRALVTLCVGVGQGVAVALSAL